MEGVIIFADDHIYEANSPESKLFEALRSEIPTLGMHNLELVKSAVKSIGSFKAIVLDWQFAQEDNLDDIQKEIGIKIGKVDLSTKEHATYNFLLTNDFYSLIYIFSNEEVDEVFGQKLREKFGDRVRIEVKGEGFVKEKIVVYKDKILNEIGEWERKNQNLSIPIFWNEAINQSFQKLLTQFAGADKNWIREIYEAGSKDGVDPELFIIELLLLQLTELLVQNNVLIDRIKTEGERKIDPELATTNQQSVAKLFSLLHYSELKSNAPIMTGDIFQLEDGLYGIIITPECDIRKVKKSKDLYFDVLKFSIASFESVSSNLPFKQSVSQLEKNIKAKNGSEISKETVALIVEYLNQESITRGFNQENPRFHFLPSLPLLSTDFNKSSIIDFTMDSVKIKSSEMDLLEKKFPRKYKLNSPFVQQLRQRYISHLGRVGVPALPNSVRNWNSNPK